MPARHFEALFDYRELPLPRAGQRDARLGEHRLDRKPG